MRDNRYSIILKCEDFLLFVKVKDRVGRKNSCYYIYVCISIIND